MQYLLSVPDVVVFCRYLRSRPFSCRQHVTSLSDSVLPDKSDHAVTLHGTLRANIVSATGDVTLRRPGSMALFQLCVVRCALVLPFFYRRFSLPANRVSFAATRRRLDTSLCTQTDPTSVVCRDSPPCMNASNQDRLTADHSPTCSLLTDQNDCPLQGSHANLRNFKPTTPKPSIPRSTAPGTGVCNTSWEKGAKYSILGEPLV